MKSTYSLLISLLLACGVTAAELSIYDGRVRESIPGQNVSAGYLTLHNGGAKDCELLAVSSADVPRIEVHEHRHAHGMMQMRKVESLIVPAAGKVVFSSGGHHLMLLDLPNPLRSGASLMLRFDFGVCGTLEETFPVVVAGGG